MMPTVNDELGKDTSPSSSTETHYHMSFEAREFIYRFLAWLYLYPDTSRLQRLRAAAAALSGDEWWRELDYAVAFERLFTLVSAVDEADAEGVVNEYNRLFLVNPQAPPHETFYLDSSGQFRGWMAAELTRIYAENGLAISPALNEMPDHLAVELEFMSHLCATAHSGNSDMIDAAIESQGTFLRQHLAKWFPKFAKQVKEAEPQHHYGAVVEATFVFLRSELASLGENERYG